MGRGKKERSRGSVIPQTRAGESGARRVPPWLRWGGAALAFVGIGFGLGLVVAWWDRPTGSAPGGEPAALERPRPLNPAEPTGAGASPAAAARLAELTARLARDPQDTAAKLALAHLYLDTARFAEAIPLYQEVLRQAPENPDALMHLGTILLWGGHGEEALRFLDRALAQDPGNPHALWDKAQAQATLLGDDAGAIRTWERFLQVAPGPEDAARVRKMMAEARTRLEERRAARVATPSRVPGSQDGGRPAPAAPTAQAPSPAGGDPTVQAARELLARIGAGRAPGGGPAPPASREASRATPAVPHPGERLFWEKGCGSCHAIGGVGGRAAPDLAGRAREEGRDAAWHVHLLREPAAVFPGTRMPSYRHLPERELQVLAEFLVTL